jgi:S-methylmethionine-dependent homocysteine/selenocysteine methylase
MSKYRHNLPQLSSGIFLSDSGLETTLVFHEGIDLPCFAAFDLLRTAEGRKTIEDYYRRHARIAVSHGTGFILESVTWRANPDWARQLGYSAEALDAINREAIEMLFAIREEFERPGAPIVVSGNIGPRGDGYDPDTFMTVAEAEAYHTGQIASFEAARADMVCALTMTYANEAIGIVRASRAAGMPVVISFTVETDGRLPSGQQLGEAIAEVDEATGGYAAYFMINCAHPDHFRTVLAEKNGWWRHRIQGVRANASRCSHAELDEASELDAGDPRELGEDYRRLYALLPNLRVLGGCCGTDHRHIEAIALACVGTGQPAGRRAIA